MRTIIVGAVAVLVVATSGWAVAETKVSCDDVAAAMDEGGGGKSADQIAAQLKISVDEVRKCMNKENAGFPAGDTGVEPAKKHDGH